MLTKNVPEKKWWFTTIMVVKVSSSTLRSMGKIKVVFSLKKMMNYFFS